ncbi:MAG: hypothetical protein H0W86_02200 [Armatimonadetes bacterium]|nr:hypothetical protein [Armatimonadota bacterium]
MKRAISLTILIALLIGQAGAAYWVCACPKDSTSTKCSCEEKRSCCDPPSKDCRVLAKKEHPETTFAKVLVSIAPGLLPAGAAPFLEPRITMRAAPVLKAGPPRIRTPDLSTETLRAPPAYA